MNEIHKNCSKNSEWGKIATTWLYGGRINEII